VARRVCPAGAAQYDLRGLAVSPATVGTGGAGARLPADDDHPEPCRRTARHWTLRGQKKDETFAQWKAGIAELGKCQNVVVKLGGLGMLFGMFDFHTREMPPSSEELARAYKPYIETCIAACGPDRGMFESNFPPDGVSSSYPMLWNAFKRLAAAFSADDKAKLFSGTARRVYRLA
jgi:predicted TIM-barrel fold metal-dependent hydrolase